jgi:hypothetical protein
MVSRFFSWAVVALLMVALAVTFSQGTMFPMDDHFAYQAFIEALAKGRLDLTIPGFHGSDFLAVPWYLISRSSTAQIEFQIFAAVCMPLCAYLAGKSLFRSEVQSVLFASIISLQPFLTFVSLRGWTGAAYWDLMLLSIATIKIFPWASAIFICLAILTKPFAVALLPLLFVMHSSAFSLKRKMVFIVSIIGLCAIYLFIQYVQAGQIIIGSHTGINQFTVWQGPMRIFLNLAHSLQILFSVHNYYPLNPSLTGPGNMMHTTPVLVFLGLIVLLSSKVDCENRKFYRAIGIGILTGLGLNVLLDHMDHFYMEAAVLLFIIAAIPELIRRPIWIPLVLATLHFQWFYFFLEYKTAFSLEYLFFLLPVFVDFIFALYCVRNFKKVYATLRAIW